MHDIYIKFANILSPVETNLENTARKYWTCSNAAEMGELPDW